MIRESLEALLEKMRAGDRVAAEQVFLAYESELRLIVRRRLSARLRAKFDSLDVVQSVWVHLLKGFRGHGWRFADAGHLRAFLTRLTHHRFIDRLRHHRLALDHERPLADDVAAADPHPADVLQADELWEQLLDLCPPAHREVLCLKREGLLLTEIAARTGLHEGSVRRILKALELRLDRVSKD